MMDIGYLELYGRICRQEREIERLRRMLYDMTSLTDWKAAGHDEHEYLAIVEQFEPAPAALDDTVEG